MANYGKCTVQTKEKHGGKLQNDMQIYYAKPLKRFITQPPLMAFRERSQYPRLYERQMRMLHILQTGVVDRHHSFLNGLQCWF